MAKKVKGNVRDLVYAGVARAILKDTGAEKIERVAQGLKFNLNDETIILRAIVKKDTVDETAKEVYTL